MYPHGDGLAGDRIPGASACGPEFRLAHLRVVHRTPVQIRRLSQHPTSSPSNYGMDDICRQIHILRACEQRSAASGAGPGEVGQAVGAVVTKDDVVEQGDAEKFACLPETGG